jgi:branched-chain amino acid transport system permease protein
MLAQAISNIILTYSVYLLVAFSFSLTYYPTKFFNFNHANIITLGAYLTFSLYRQCNLNLLSSILISVLLSSLIGLGSEIIIYKKLRKRNAKPFSLLIASLGLYIVLQNTISIIWGNNVKTIGKPDVVLGKVIFGAHLTDIQIITVLVGVIILILIWLFYKHSKLGLHVLAVSSNEHLSTIFGINSNRINVKMFILSSSTASFAGILYSLDSGMNPSMGFNLLLYGIISMIIGGLGNIWGLFVGTLFLATSQFIGGYFLDNKWMNAIAYIILILFLIWKPFGFGGNRLKKTEI